MNKISFLAGIEKRAEELHLTTSLKTLIKKLGGVFNTEDDISAILTQPGAMDSELGAYKAALSHAKAPISAGAVLGGLAGGSLGSIFTKDKTQKNKNVTLGAGAGGLLGGLAGGLNDLRQLKNNTPEHGSDW